METQRSGRRNAVIALIGLGAGLSSAFFGIGGGLVLVPALTLLLHLPIKHAVGTSLVVVLFTSTAGVLMEWEVNGTHIDWPWALVLGLGSLLGSALAGRLITRIPESVMRLVFAAVMLAASIRMSVDSLGPSGALATFVTRTPIIEHLLVLLIGLVAGVTSVLFGVGGGIVVVPGLALLRASLPFATIRGTSLAAIVVAAAAGAPQHARAGHVDLGLTWRLVPAGLAGAALGVIAATYIPARMGQLAFATFLSLVAVRLAVQVFHRPGDRQGPFRAGRGVRRAGASAK